MTSQQASSPLRPADDDVALLFRARYLEMVRLAGLLGADDPEDIAQEAFARLMRKGALGASPQAVREDRILHEAQASGGDVRRLMDMFGLSVKGASRYTGTLDHPGLHNAFDWTPA